MVALSGCATTPELTVLVGPKRVESYDTELGASIILIQKWGKHGVVGWSHQSDVFRGKPFNDKPEMQADQVGVGFRVGGK